jgi:hypothetical protein
MNTLPEKQIRIYDLYDLWYEPFWQKPWFIVLASVLSVMLLIGFVWLLMYYRKKQKSLLTPWQEALQDLENLVHENYNLPTKHKEFYQQVTAVLKKYLSRRYGCVLVSKTDQEIITVLAQTEFSQDLRQQLEEIMQGAVFIKFANQQAIKEQMKLDLQRAQELVRKTTPG